MYKLFVKSVKGRAPAVELCVFDGNKNVYSPQPLEPTGLLGRDGKFSVDYEDNKGR